MPQLAGCINTGTDLPVSNFTFGASAFSVGLTGFFVLFFFFIFLAFLHAPCEQEIGLRAVASKRNLVGWFGATEELKLPRKIG